MTEINVLPQTITIKNQGITYALKDMIDSMPKSIMSDGKITREEWDKTIDKLVEINRSRDEDNKIFKGCDDKNSNKCLIVMPKQKINFTSDEMAELYDAMGVSFKNDGDDYVLPQKEAQNVCTPKINNEQKHEKQVEKQAKDTTVVVDTSKTVKDTVKADSTNIDSVKSVANTSNGVVVTNNQAEYQDKKTYWKKLAIKVGIGVAAVGLAALGVIFAKRGFKLKKLPTSVYKQNIDNFIINHNPTPLMKPPADLAALKDIKPTIDGKIKIPEEILEKYPPIHIKN